MSKSRELSRPLYRDFWRIFSEPSDIEVPEPGAVAYGDPEDPDLLLRYGDEMMEY